MGIKLLNKVSDKFCEFWLGCDGCEFIKVLSVQIRYGIYYEWNLMVNVYDDMK